MLLDNSQKEIEKRNPKTYGRARALNKLAKLFVDRMRQIKVPNEVTYDSFRDFVQEVQKAFLVTEVDLRNWFPRISPFFILDRRKFQMVFEKARDLHEGFTSFLTKEYVKTKTLEDTFQLLDRLQVLEQQHVNLKNQKTKIQNEKSHFETEIAEMQRRMADLKGKGSLGQMSQVAAEVATLSFEVKQNLQHLQKPFIKLQSLATHGEGSGLIPDELNKLNQYVDNPFEAFAAEEGGLPLLKSILGKLSRAMSEDKLKLKPEKTRKAEQLVESIVRRDSLESLHKKSTDVVMRRKQLSASAELAETERALSRLREQLEELDRKKRVIEGEQVTLERVCDETVEKIRTHKAQIEKNVFDFLNKRIAIE